MERLPMEIIETIMLNPNLQIKDCVRLASVSTYLRTVVINSQCLWRQKFRQHFPELSKIFVKEPNYYDEIRCIYQLREKVYQILERMPNRFYKKYEISESELVDWKHLVEERSDNIHYVMYFLREIINTQSLIETMEVVPLRTTGNQTLQYYARKSVRYVVQLHMSIEWANYIRLPQDQQLLETGACILAQWCQPYQDVRLSEIAVQLDNIAIMVTQYVVLTYPRHPLLKANSRDLDQWRSENIQQSKWSFVSCMEIVASMKAVMYNSLGFCGNKSYYYAPENSYINEVLERKTGLPITLAIIYAAVGRRLGVLFEPISFPDHFLVRLRENGRSQNLYYIDVFNTGDIIRRGICPHAKEASAYIHSFKAADAQEVIERMANNLELSTRQHSQPNGRVTRLRSILELLKLISPRDINVLLNLAKFYMLHHMDAVPLREYISEQCFEVPEQALHLMCMLGDYSKHQMLGEYEGGRTTEVAKRTDDLKYAVGMVMRHLTLHYKCVIYDWDPICLATGEWQYEMNVDKLHYRDQQPFYNVLVEDGSYRYVAQENLAPTSNRGALHLNEDLGRYFSHYYKSHYIPNAEKEHEYPEDERIRYREYYNSVPTD